MSLEDGRSRVLSIHLHNISHHLHALRPGLLLPGFPPGHDGGDQLQLGLLCKVTHIAIFYIINGKCCPTPSPLLLLCYDQGTPWIPKTRRLETSGVILFS